MEEIDVKQSLYIYNSGDLKRKDNTLRFTNYEGGHLCYVRNVI